MFLTMSFNQQIKIIQKSKNKGWFKPNVIYQHD